MKWRLWIAPLLIGIALFGCGKQSNGLLQNSGQVSKQDSVSTNDFENRRKYASADLRFAMTLGMFVAEYNEESLREPACQIIEAYYSLNYLYGMKDPHEILSKDDAMDFINGVSNTVKNEIEDDALRYKAYQIGIGVGGIMVAAKISEEMFDAEENVSSKKELLNNDTYADSKMKLIVLYNTAFVGLAKFSEELGISSDLQNQLGDIKNKALSLKTKSDAAEMSLAIAKWGQKAAEEVSGESGS